MSRFSVLSALMTAVGLTLSGCASTAIRMDAAAMPPMHGEEPPVAPAVREEIPATPPVAADAMQPGQTYQAVRGAETDEQTGTLHGEFVRYDHSDPARPRAVFQNAVMEYRTVIIQKEPPLAQKLPYISRLFKTTGTRLEPDYEPVLGECPVKLSDLRDIHAVPREEAIHSEWTESTDGGKFRSTSIQVKRGDEAVKERIGIDFDFQIPEAQ